MSSQKLTALVVDRAQAPGAVRVQRRENRSGRDVEACCPPPQDEVELGIPLVPKVVEWVRARKAIAGEDVD